MQGAINVVSQRSSSNHMNIVEPINAKKSQNKLETFNEVPKKAAAYRKFDPFE